MYFIRAHTYILYVNQPVNRIKSEWLSEIAEDVSLTGLALFICSSKCPMDLASIHKTKRDRDASNKEKDNTMENSTAGGNNTRLWATGIFPGSQSRDRAGQNDSLFQSFYR